MSNHVWVFNVDAEGPEGGDYDGRQTVHATLNGAMHALFDFVYDLGVDPRDPEATVITANTDREDGSRFADMETSNGWTVSYGIHRAEILP